MMVEFYISVLFWYGFVGWCTAQLHYYLGFLSRYRGIKFSLAWTAIFFFWPVTLPMFVDVMSHMLKGDK